MEYEKIKFHTGLISPEVYIEMLMCKSCGVCVGEGLGIEIHDKFHDSWSSIAQSAYRANVMTNRLGGPSMESTPSTIPEHLLKRAQAAREKAEKEK